MGVHKEDQRVGSSEGSSDERKFKIYGNKRFALTVPGLCFRILSGTTCELDLGLGHLYL